MFCPKCRSPWWYVSLSSYYLEQCDELLIVKHIGIDYYVAITPSIRQLLLTIGEDNVEQMMRDLIGLIYLQVRDTVGHEIHRDLRNQISDGFTRLFDRALQKKIEEQFYLEDKRK